MSNVTIGNLKTPKKMPESQVQRIKNLTCPPPIMPSKTSKRIQDLLNQIQNQKQEIELLENQVNDLESRYKIFFSVNQCQASPFHKKKSFYFYWPLLKILSYLDKNYLYKQPHNHLQVIYPLNGFQ